MAVKKKTKPIKILKKIARPKPMTLRAWIEKTGVDEVVRLLKVKPAAVRHWRRGANLPSDETKLKIMKLTRGAVSPSEMVCDHFKAAKK